MAPRCAGRTRFLWEPRPAANGASSAPSFAPGSGLLQIQPVHGAALCWSHAFSVGAATRGEWRQLGAKSFAPGSGLLQIQPVHGAALCRSHAFSVAGATRGEWRQLGAKSFAPRSGLLQIEPVHGAASCRSHAFAVGGATRGEWRQLGARKASPRGRASHKSSPCMPLRCAGRTLFLWEAGPAANGASSVPKSFAPRSGLYKQHCAPLPQELSLHQASPHPGWLRRGATTRRMHAFGHSSGR